MREVPLQGCRGPPHSECVGVLGGRRARVVLSRPAAGDHGVWFGCKNVLWKERVGGLTNGRAGERV